VKEIPLTFGKVAIVDDEDYERVARFKWFATREMCGGVATWRAMRKRRRSEGAGGPVGLHRQVIDAPRGIRVDHKDGDGLNNTRENLRLASAQQNAQNRRRKSPWKTSRFRGVTWHKKDRRWRARIRVALVPGEATRLVELGGFLREEDAAAAYDRAALTYFGQFAAPNSERTYGDGDL